MLTPVHNGQDPNQGHIAQYIYLAIPPHHQPKGRDDYLN